VEALKNLLKRFFRVRKSHPDTSMLSRHMLRDVGLLEGRSGRPQSKGVQESDLAQDESAS